MFEHKILRFWFENGGAEVNDQLFGGEGPVNLADGIREGLYPS